jgi:hypothetical protein
LNAEGVEDAEFVIKIYGALETRVNSNVVLINGAQAKNVFWLVNGAVDIFDNSVFNGTLIVQGAFNVYDAVELNGRALCVVGAMSTNAINGSADIDTELCGVITSIIDETSNASVNIFPNPMGDFTTIDLRNFDNFIKVELHMYNILGVEILNKNITSNSTTFDTSSLSSGVYLYRVTRNGIVIHSGKLILQ